MPTFRTDDGVTLSYQVFGEGPFNLLFMHGWGGSGAYFTETIQNLNMAGLQVITFDFRGHGSSEKVDKGYTLDQFAHDTLAVADQIGAGKFVVVGFSMSGKFAQYLQVVEPGRVLGQILVSGFPTTEIPFPIELQHDWVSRAGNSQKMIDLLKNGFLSQPVKSEVLQRSGDEAAKATAQALDETLNMACRISFVDKIQNSQLPTLVIGGLTDPMCPPDMLRQTMVAPFPGTRLALVDANHEIPMEKPLELAGLIEAFLAGLRSK
jgi:pimeloyl-ACP methyl ester carboxylesterase